MPEEEYRKFYPAGARRFLGLKMHRITGSDAKEPYDRGMAMNRAREHARHFVEMQVDHLRSRRAKMPTVPIIVSPFDAELFGHWWFEGPEWIEAVIRIAGMHPGDIRLASPGDYLSANDTHEVVSPAESSWGDGGYHAMWLDPSNAWVYPALHDAERKMISSARQFSQGTALGPIEDRCLAQLARELLLAQSSDWAFLIRSGTARDYASHRTHRHLGRFGQLHSQLHSGRIETALLENCEEHDNLFPRLNWRIYA